MKTAEEWVSKLWPEFLPDTFDGYVELVDKIQRDALEEAAKAVEDTDIVEDKNSYYAQLGDAFETRKAAAQAVRALMNPTCTNCGSGEIYSGKCETCGQRNGGE